MPTRHLVIALTAAAFACGTLTAPASAQVRQDPPQAGVKKPQAKKRIVRRSAAGGQIACTPFGCHRIPRNCYPTQGYNWDGIPTGYDVVVCR